MISILLFVCVLLGGVTLAIFSNPSWAFILYQLIYFFNPQGRWWGGSIPDLAYSFMSVMLMFFVFAVHFKKHNDNKIMKVPQLKWMYVLMVIYLLTNIYAINADATKEASINFLKLVIIVSVAFKLIAEEKDLHRVLWGYVWSACYLAFYIYQVGRNSGHRVEGVGTVDAPDANGVALALAPAAIITFYFFWSATTLRARIFATLTGAFIVNSLVLINSRASILGVISGMLLFVGSIFLSNHIKGKQKANLILIVILGLFGALMVVDQSFIDRFRSIQSVEMEEDQETGATRVFFWMAALEMSKDYPFGQGYKGFNAHSDKYIPEHIDTGGSRNRSVHSTWMQCLTEAGYQGSLAFLLMLFLSLRTMSKVKKRAVAQGQIDRYFKALAIQSALLTYVVGMTFMNRLTAEILYWLVMFTACAYNIYYLKEEEQKA